MVVDLAGKYTSFNSKFSEMWRIPAHLLAKGESNQILPFVANQLIKPEDFIRKTEQLYSQPDKESFDVLDFKDGRTFERYSQPQRTNDRVIGRVWSFRDVTHRRQAEQKSGGIRSRAAGLVCGDDRCSDCI